MRHLCETLITLPPRIYHRTQSIHIYKATFGAHLNDLTRRVGICYEHMYAKVIHTRLAYFIRQVFLKCLSHLARPILFCRILTPNISEGVRRPTEIC